MNTQIKFKNMQTASDLRTRISHGNLSVGNNMDVVRKLATQTRVADDQIETAVTYTPQHGKITKVWFI